MLLHISPRHGQLPRLVRPVAVSVTPAPEPTKPTRATCCCITPSGLGNSTGYANAVALLERYVPVTGFINGVFGAVAGGACMVGPVLVATIAKRTSLRWGLGEAKTSNWGGAGRGVVRGQVCKQGGGVRACMVGPVLAATISRLTSLG